MSMKKIKMTQEEREFDTVGRLEYLKTNFLFITALISTPILGVGYFMNEINQDIFFLSSFIPILILMLGIEIGISDKPEDMDGVVKNTKKEEHFINLGYMVQEHDSRGASKDFTKDNIVYPINISKTHYSTHMNIIGTTGSGKTVMAKSMMRQIIRDIGTGYLIIEGKGDSGMLHEMYAECVVSKREHDFFVLNFLDKHNSNTLNPLELGDYDSIVNLLKDFMFATGNGDTWEEGGKELFEGVLKPIIVLRDSNLIWNPKYTKEINTIEDIEQYRDDLSIPVLRDFIQSPMFIFEFAMAISRLYKNDRVEFEKRLKTNNIRKNKNEYFDANSERIEIHDILKGVLMTQGQEIPEWEKVVELGSYSALLDSVKDKGKAIYKIQISTGFFGKMFQVFIGQFGEVFAVREGDINLEDILVNNKILHIALQGINPEVASGIGKFMLSLIRMVAKKRGKKKALRAPYTLFLDEFNSWSKGIEGFADLMSVTRSYGLTFCIMYQSDLSKIDDGKGIEKGQILANTNTTIYLKVVDVNIIKDLIDKLPKDKVFRKNLKVTSSKDTDKDTEITYTDAEVDYMKTEEMMNLKGGQGFVYINGIINKMVSTYISDNTRYDINSENDIPIIKLVKKDIKITQEL